MTRKRRVVLIIGVVLALLSAGGVLIAVTAYVRSVRTWSDDHTFASKVADGVAEAVADGVMLALQRVDQELADNAVAGKIMTVEELSHLRDLCARGEHERARRELLSRHSRQELAQLRRELERLAQQFGEPAP